MHTTQGVWGPGCNLETTTTIKTMSISITSRRFLLSLCYYRINFFVVRTLYIRSSLLANFKFMAQYCLL